MREYLSLALCDQIHGMKTCHEIRKEQLVALVKESGGVPRLAELLEKSEGQIRQWTNASKDSRTGRPRGISDDKAREIEEKLGKEVGWLDNDPELVNLSTNGAHLSPSARAVVDLVVEADANKLPAHLFDSLSAALRVWLSQPGVTEGGKGD